MEITYLLNSGFLIRYKNILLVFDDYADPTDEVQKSIDAGNFDRLYIFATHFHADHFDTHIVNYSEAVHNYIFSYDIKKRRKNHLKIFPTDKLIIMQRYDNWNDDVIQVHSFDSTDSGLSYAVEFSDGVRIFHAGDFNLWYWIGQPESHQIKAKNEFDKQMEKIAGMKFDVTFFPIDGRLKEFQESGAQEFIRLTDTRYLISMHNVGFDPWIPSSTFFGDKSAIPYWSPKFSGDKIVVSSE